MKSDWQATPEVAYQAAAMAIQGFSHGKIAKAIFKSKTPTAIRRIGGLLRHAEEAGLLRLQCPTNEELEKKLAARFGQRLTFHVVNNDQPLDSTEPMVEDALRSDAISRQTARVVAARISELLAGNRGRELPIVIANAGGYAMSRVVRFLPSYKTVPEDSNPGQLLFISLNSASIPTNYGLSSNALAVRMAEIYGAHHIALCPIWPEKVATEYARAVRHLDLLICGAGTDEGMLFKWLQSQVDIKLPRAAVGDICLIPISADGEELPLAAGGPERIRKYLNPGPAYADLQSAADANRVILMLKGYERDDLKSDQRPASVTHSKLAIARAILAGKLSRTFVLGATLAHDLLAAP